MDRERWERIKRIFDEALARDEAERDRFLVEACGADAELLAELRSLLAAFAESFLEPKPTLSTSGGTPESLVGTAVGDYRVIEPLARGGMGEIYKAVNVRTGEVIAVKRLGERALGQDNATRRFLREVRAAMETRHPHVARVRGLADWPGEPLLLMDFVEGRTLREHLKSRRLTVSEALGFAVQAASALAEAHSIGIVHRDVKPDNFMVTPEGALKLLDFGLAKIVESEDIHRALTISKSKLSDDGLVLGSASYMSPEQVKGEVLDGRSDVFSLGVLVYEMLTGERAFDGKTPLATVTAILFEEPAPLSAKLRGAPNELEDVVRRATSKKPSERFQTMAELKTALAELNACFEDGTLSLERTSKARRSPMSPVRWLRDFLDRLSQ